MKKQHAFTLVELIVTLAVLAVLLTVGAPMMGNMLESNRASVRSVELRKALVATQRFATNMNVVVSLCPVNGANDGCDASDPIDWSNGWLIISDPDGAGIKKILHVFQSTEGPHTIAGPPDFIRYSPSGVIDDPVVFSIKYPHCVNEQAREVNVSVTGRVLVEAKACF